jgi:uncharacterized protein (TIGR02246 family)
MVLLFAASAPVALIAASADETAINELTAKFVAAWNHHDTAAMAATWAEDADLINPAGRVAKGRAAIQQLLTDEHATAMKGTTFKLVSHETRMLNPTTALVDWTIVITGMRGPDGNAMPPNNLHVFVVFAKHDGKWLVEATRPYAFQAMPPGVG